MSSPCLWISSSVLFLQQHGINIWKCMGTTTKIPDSLWILGKNLNICVSEHLESISQIGIESSSLGSFTGPEESPA